MAIVTCPSCKTRVHRSSDGICPQCRSAFGDAALTEEARKPIGAPPHAGNVDVFAAPKVEEPAAAPAAMPVTPQVIGPMLGVVVAAVGLQLYREGPTAMTAVVALGAAGGAVLGALLIQAAMKKG